MWERDFLREFYLPFCCTPDGRLYDRELGSPMSPMKISLLITSGFLLSTVLYLGLHLRKKFMAIKKLQLDIERLKEEMREAEIKATQLNAELSAAKETIELERRTFSEGRNQLQDTFKSLAAHALEGNSKQFIELARQSLERESLKNKNELDKKQMAIDELVKPLKNSLEGYQNQVNEMEKSRQRSYSIVESELKKVTEISTQLSRETTALKDALKKPHIRGRWGEVQLKNCIDMAGMSDYSDVNMQDVHSLDEKRRLIPDMTVKMPGGHIIVVDAKTPIDAFMASLEASTEEERKGEMFRHGQHVKSHIKQLATKEYQNHVQGSADFTVMFLPNESFLYAALESQADLMEYALEKKVLIATPPTLIGLLRVIRYGWNEQKLAENAQKISETGRELHKRVSDFLSAYTNIGKQLDKAQSEFEVGWVRLQSRVLTQAKRLEDLGAKGSKELPETRV